MNKTKAASFWRITMRMVIERPNEHITFTRHSKGVPGTRPQAIRHLRSVYAGMWPSAKVRLVSAIPDRQAEKKVSA